MTDEIHVVEPVATITSVVIPGAQGAVGPEGPQGEVGAVGPEGPQGEVGPTGPDGPQGEVGAVGLVGATGPQGVDGSIGATGPQGVVGPIGATGPQGVDGSIGATGPQGVVGASGIVLATAPLTYDAPLQTVGITPATPSADGTLSATDKTKLDGVAPQATQNATDAALRDRATHTGSQLASSISNLAAAIAATVIGGGSVTVTANPNGTLNIVGTGITQEQADARYSGLTHPHAASAITSGLLNDARLSAQVVRLNASNRFQLRQDFGYSLGTGFASQLYVSGTAGITQTLAVANAAAAASVTALEAIGSADGVTPALIARAHHGSPANVGTALDVRSTSSVAAQAGFGVRVSSSLNSSVSVIRTASADDVVWTDATDAIRTAERRISLTKNGVTLEALRIGGAGDTTFTFWNRAAKAVSSDQAVILEDIASDGRMRLRHTTGVGSIEFWHGGSPIRIMGAMLTDCYLGPTRLASEGNVTNDVRLQVQRTGVGSGQEVELWTQQLAPLPANVVPPGLKITASAIRLGTHTNADFGFVAGFVERARVEAPTLADDTALLLLHGGTLKRVTVGAPDSGGAGQRMLTVAN